MRGLYLDAYSGLSGDMLLGALLDLGASLPDLECQLATLGVGGWRLEVEEVTRQGLHGARARVVLDAAEQPHRHLSDVRALIESAPLAAAVKRNAVAAFELLGAAEAKVHGVSIEEVHFHEVGAVDAIVDVVGVCTAVELLGVQDIVCSPLPLGNGLVEMAHGLWPVPGPATAELLAGCRASVLPGGGQGEMVTPTGAALVAHLARFEGRGPVQLRGVGYGFGERELPWPNALRALLVDGGTYRPEREGCCSR